MSEIAELYKQGVPDDDLRLHLLGEGKDLSRYCGDLTPVNAPCLGHEMHFVAASNQYLRRAVSDWRPSDEVGTITAWINMDSVGINQTIFGSADEATDLYYLQLRIRNDNYLAIYQTNNDPLSVIRGGTALSASRWYHVAVVSTGSAYTLYVNGQPETLTVVSGTNNGDWLSDTSGRDSITVGALNRTGLVHYFNGSIRDVSYYSAAKSADWIADLWRRTRVYY